VCSPVRSVPTAPLPRIKISVTVSVTGHLGLKFSDYIAKYMPMSKYIWFIIYVKTAHLNTADKIFLAPELEVLEPPLIAS